MEGEMKRIIILVTVVFHTCLIGAAVAAIPVGIILGGSYDGCIIKQKINDAKVPCKYGSLLYPGDQIAARNVKDLKIQWLAAPYTKFEPVGSETVKVVYEPPPDKKSIIETIPGADSVLKKARYVYRKAWSRPLSPVAIPQPGYRATLIPDLPVTFTWRGTGGRTIVFKDSKGLIVFTQPVSRDTDSIILTSSQIGMTVSETYFWEVEGAPSGEKYRVRLLSEDLVRLIKADLSAIDKTPDLNPDDKIIRKSIYLQLMSEGYPGEINLYWWSYSLLKGLNDPESEAAKWIEFTYREHLEETLTVK